MSCSIGVLTLDEQPVETTVASLTPLPPSLPGTPPTKGMSLLRVGSLIVGDRRRLCLIRNVSVGGMLIACSTIEPGARVAIELKQGEPVYGEALWTGTTSSAFSSTARSAYSPDLNSSRCAAPRCRGWKCDARRGFATNRSFIGLARSTFPKAV